MEQRPGGTAFLPASFDEKAWTKRLEEVKKRAYKGDLSVIPELDRIISEGKQALAAKEASPQ